MFVAMLSFPRTVLSLKQSTEPMQVHRVGCFIFTYKNTLKKAEIVELVLRHIEKMERAFKTTPRPFIYTIAMDGQLRRYV